MVSSEKHFIVILVSYYFRARKYISNSTTQSQNPYSYIYTCDDCSTISTEIKNE